MPTEQGSQLSSVYCHFRSLIVEPALLLSPAQRAPWQDSSAYRFFPYHFLYEHLLQLYPLIHTRNLNVKVKTNILRIFLDR